MRYQQTPVTRLARAGRKLTAGHEWQPAEEEGVFLRVSEGVLQRVRLENSESEEHMRLFRDFDPLPSRALKEGFREELCFRVADDHYEICGLLVRVYVGWDMLAAAAEKLGASVTFLGGNSLLCSVAFEQWERGAILRALVLAKAFMKVAAQLALDAKDGVPHIPAEVDGLLRTAYTLFLEDVQQQAGRRRKQTRGRQESLFPDQEA
jgi:hypothetical protein